jgi:hypothetical protein
MSLSTSDMASADVDTLCVNQNFKQNYKEFLVPWSTSAFLEKPAGPVGVMSSPQRTLFIPSVWFI